ncbi:MAG TPA: tRNA lysidine(34) synthetase TilS [Candidatus Saccharimonadales bacterium]|jgi:tRNA(Ile)-lysidine synthase
MNISIPVDPVIGPGRYIIAVSGGVDSMVLLDLLRLQPGMSLTVAHFNHGIREDSAEDRKLVQRIAGLYGLPFRYAEGRLGPGASEAAAREARYAFLHEIRKSVGADAVVTAHHQDDVVETAILNIIRGSGRKGLTSLRSTEFVRRPLLHAMKSQILEYAEHHDLEWREDSTNADDTYVRNHIRHTIVPRLGADGRQGLVNILDSARITNDEIDITVDAMLHDITADGRLNRQSFILLEHAVAREVLAQWLRSQGFRELDRRLLERITLAAKTYTVGKSADIGGGRILRVCKNYLALEVTER